MTRWRCTAAWRLAMSSQAAYRHTGHGIRIGERPAAVLRDARFRPATCPAARWAADHRPQFRAVARTPAAGRQVIAVELQGHEHTADTGRPMTIEALAGDVVALLDHLGIAEADLFGFSLGGLVACAVALGAPARAGKLIVASADAHRPPGRESAPLGEDRLPTAGRLPGVARCLRGGRSRPGAFR